MIGTPRARAVKISKGGMPKQPGRATIKYGLSDNAEQYLGRMEASNMLFGGDNQYVEGISKDGRFWISQPWIEGY